MIYENNSLPDTSATHQMVYPASIDFQLVMLLACSEPDVFGILGWLLWKRKAYFLKLFTPDFCKYIELFLV